MQALDMRAADADRERVLAELERHTSAGRLTFDEFSERAAAAYQSQTMGELAALTADLPHSPAPDSLGGRRIPAAGIAAIVSIVAVVAMLGLAAAAYAAPMMGGLGCG